MTPEPTQPAAPTAKRRRWWRIARWLVVLWVVGGCGYKAWRWYDFREAMKEAKALGWHWQYDDPWDAVQKDWKAAFRGATWNEGKRELVISGAEDLEGHGRLLHRLAPRNLRIQNASGLKELSVLEGLSGLQVLTLNYCPGVSELGALAKLPALQSLTLAGFTGLRELGPLAKLPALRELYLIGCTGVTELAPLAKLTALQFLSLHDCTAVRELGPLAKLPALQSLSLYGCTGVTELAPLAQLPALQSLALNYCTGVTELAPLAKLPALQDLFLIGCMGLKAGEAERLRAALPKCDISEF